ncbi:hypothetical protein STVA_20600 [Allostella vacuolata]|nr:hypothetical protein STVA_20600 [Stella vacuolata]
MPPGGEEYGGQRVGIGGRPVTDSHCLIAREPVGFLHPGRFLPMSLPPSEVEACLRMLEEAGLLA